jgi:hypothetical protein
VGDKAAMARAFQARCSMGKVLFPAYPWADRVINQCVGFPAGKHDDAVDCCALIGLALDSTWGQRPVRALVQPQVQDRWGRLFSRSRHRDFSWKVL